MSAVDWTQTKGQGLTSDTSAMDGAEYRHGTRKYQSSAITPVTVVKLPTQEETDRIVAQAAAERII